MPTLVDSLTPCVSGLNTVHLGCVLLVHKVARGILIHIHICIHIFMCVRHRDIYLFVNVTLMRITYTCVDDAL